MTKLTHKSAVEQVRKLIAGLNGTCWVNAQSAKLYGSAGIPDIFCVVPRCRLPLRNLEPPSHLAFWTEIKVGKDRLSIHQTAFKIKSELAGIPVIVGTAGNVADYLGI